MRSKKKQNIFSDRNKYEKNIFKKFGSWFGSLKGWQKAVSIIVAIVVIVGIALAVYVYGKLNQVDKVELTMDETELSCVDVDGYINILLLGVDSRDMSDLEGTNTDAIMVISINEETWDVNLISVYRDTYLPIGDTGSYNKINSAFAQGGAAQTIKSLNQSMDLNISNYILVNFNAVADLVNAVDGITVDVQEEEIEQLNKYTKETAKIIGQKDYQLVEKAGEQTLEGVQAVSYGRIRKGVGDDYKRTERMRTVLTKVTEKLKTASVSQLNDIINLMTAQCQTNLSNNDILGLAARIAKYNFVGSTGWPYNVTSGYIGKVSYVFPDDLAENTTKLHQEMFGQEDYTPSDTVVSIGYAILEAVNGASNTIQNPDKEDSNSAGSDESDKNTDSKSSEKTDSNKTDSNKTDGSSSSGNSSGSGSDTTTKPDSSGGSTDSSGGSTDSSGGSTDSGGGTTTPDSSGSGASGGTSTEGGE